jgi:hypothetical protein
MGPWTMTRRVLVDGCGPPRPGKPEGTRSLSPRKAFEFRFRLLGSNQRRMGITTASVSSSSVGTICAGDSWS